MRELLNDAEFSEVVEGSDGVVLVDFFATWCNPCKNLAIQLEQIEGLNIVKVDIEELPITTSTYGVQGLPTLALFKDGQMVGKTTGFMPKEAIINWVESN